LHTKSFYLGDFGLALKRSDSPDSECEDNLTIQFLSPERLHKKVPSVACGMWSYMCIFAELYLDFIPFTTMVEDGSVTAMVNSLGALPENWKNDYLYPRHSHDSWYNQDSRPSPDFNHHTQIACAHPNVSSHEQELVHCILAGGFTYDPEKRLTAAQLLQDASVQGLMDIYC
jgi:serine/threonine protein kinase